MEICAPFAGIVHYHVHPGDNVDTGELLAVVEAVKLEAPVYAPGPGRVRTCPQEDFGDVSGGDVIVILEEN